MCEGRQNAKGVAPLVDEHAYQNVNVWPPLTALLLKQGMWPIARWQQ